MSQSATQQSIAKAVLKNEWAVGNLMDGENPDRWQTELDDLMKHEWKVYSSVWDEFCTPNS